MPGTQNQNHKVPHFTPSDRPQVQSCHHQGVMRMGRHPLGVCVTAITLEVHLENSSGGEDVHVPRSAWETSTEALATLFELDPPIYNPHFNRI